MLCHEVMRFSQNLIGLHGFRLSRKYICQSRRHSAGFPVYNNTMRFETQRPAPYRTIVSVPTPVCSRRWRQRLQTEHDLPNRIPRLPGGSLVCVIELRRQTVVQPFGGQRLPLRIGRVELEARRCVLLALNDLLHEDVRDRRENLNHHAVNVPEQLRPLDRRLFRPTAVDRLQKVTVGSVDRQRELVTPSPR